MSLCGSLNVFVWVIVCISLCLHFVVAVCLWMSFACLCVFAVIMRVITCVWLCICAFVFVNVCMLYVCLRVLFVNLCMSFVRVCKYAMMFVCIYMLWFFNGVCVWRWWRCSIHVYALYFWKGSWWLGIARMGGCRSWMDVICCSPRLSNKQQLRRCATDTMLHWLASPHRRNT